MHEADAVQEVPDLGRRVVEREAPRRIEGTSRLVLDAGRMVEVEQRLSLKATRSGGSQRATWPKLPCTTVSCSA